MTPILIPNSLSFNFFFYSYLFFFNKNFFYYFSFNKSFLWWLKKYFISTFTKNLHLRSDTSSNHTSHFLINNNYYFFNNKNILKKKEKVIIILKSNILFFNFFKINLNSYLFKFYFFIQIFNINYGALTNFFYKNFYTTSHHPVSYFSLNIHFL